MAPSRPVPTSTTIKVSNRGKPAIYAIHSGPQRGVHLLSSAPLDSSLQYRYRHPINLHRTFLTVSGDFLRRRFDTIEAAIKWIDERDREKELSDRLEAVCMTGTAITTTPTPATTTKQAQAQETPTDATNPVQTWINTTHRAIPNDARVDKLWLAMGNEEIATTVANGDGDDDMSGTISVAATPAQQTGEQSTEQYTEYTLPSGLIVRRLIGHATGNQPQQPPPKEKWLIDRYCPGGEEAEVQVAAEKEKIQAIIEELAELTTEDGAARKETRGQRDREREMREQRKREPVWKHVQVGGIKKVSHASNALQASLASPAESSPTARRGITMDVIAVKGRYSMTHLGARRRELLYSLVVEERDKETIRRQEEQERINRLQLAGIKTGDIVGRLGEMDLEGTRAASMVADDGMEIEEEL